MAAESENTRSIQVKWGGQTLEIRDLLASPASSIGDLKNNLFQLTRVRPERQKLVGLKVAGNRGAVVAPKLPDDILLSSLTFCGNICKAMMVGTPEELIFVDWSIEADNQDVLNDLDYDYSLHQFSDSASDEKSNNNENDSLDLMKDKRNIRKIKEIVSNTQLQIIHPLRAGKKLLVLDLDFTLFDMKSEASTFTDLKRPYTDEFLISVYAHYDICIWSQTSWRWLEIKLTELGLLTHPAYRISFVLDKTAMFSLKMKDLKHSVKPLAVIWQLLPSHNAHSTVHVDDLGRNFAMNPRSGVKIPAFKNFRSQSEDSVLLHLAKYLLHIAKSPSLLEHDHHDWIDQVNRL